MTHPATETLFLQPCEFVMGGVSLEAMPPGDYPEIAFAGRSNVGKSSLVNALTGRRTLAKTSGTPGRTREINFFLLAQRLMLVDLPGYGYARAPKKDVDRWTDLVLSYLRGRPNLMRVCLLIDARHGVKDVDRGIMKLLDNAAVSYQLVLTKADKIKPAALTELIEATHKLMKRHTAAHPEILATSSHANEGIGPLRAELAGFTSKIR